MRNWLSFFVNVYKISSDTSVIIFVVTLFLTMHESVIEVIPNLIVSIPISTISPILAVDTNSILEMHFITTLDDLIWHAANINAYSSIYSKTLPPKRVPFKFKSIADIILLVLKIIKISLK
jgi:hypothetical protein